MRFCDQLVVSWSVVPQVGTGQFVSIATGGGIGTGDGLRLSNKGIGDEEVGEGVWYRRSLSGSVEEVLLFQGLFGSIGPGI